MLRQQKLDQKMATVEPPDGVLGITRSQTEGDYSLKEDQPNEIKLHRIASNGDIFGKKAVATGPSEPGLLQRSRSVDNKLAQHFKDSLTFEEEEVPQMAQQMFQMPPSPFIPPVQPSFDPQMPMTPLNYSFVPPSPTAFPTPAAFPALGLPGSPIVYGAQTPTFEQMGYFQQPLSPMFSPMPMTPQMGPMGLSSLQLPSPRNNVGYVPPQRTLSGNNNHFQRRQSSGFERSKADVMLEELRMKVKGGRRDFGGFGVEESWSLSSIKGSAEKFARDQFGSRFIQQKLEDSRVALQEKEELFQELSPYIPDLCKDVFGNYVVQKLLEVGVGSKMQHNYIYKSAIKGQMFELSRHMYGCRVVQKLVEQIFGSSQTSAIDAVDDVYDVRTQDLLLQELDQDLLSLVFDQNGNHVIQKCIEKIKPFPRLKFFFDCFRGQYVVMSTHSYGCRVVQRVLETKSLSVISEVVSELMTDLMSLITDQYSNYVIQHILQHHKDYAHFVSASNGAIGSLANAEQEILERLTAQRKTIYNTIAGNLLFFSQHKFGSNVVECCLKSGSFQDKQVLVSKVLEANTLVLMMKDPYANYVVQKVIDAASKSQLEAIVKVVQQNEAVLRRLTYGKHILNKLKMNNFGFQQN